MYNNCTKNEEVWKHLYKDDDNRKMQWLNYFVVDVKK